MNQIVGIFLIRNEEYFIAWSLMNAVNFCDHIIVLDNLSTDRTREIVDNIAHLHNHIEVIEVRNANNTQTHLEKYFGTPTWVLGIDGDEIHDPVGLACMRTRLQSGEFDHLWSVASRYLHVTEFDFSDFIVRGYPSPPAKAGLKLYNFAAIDNWQSKWRKRERLHGKGLVFREGYSKQKTYSFSKETTWNAADFRCLHLCFLQRSSQDKYNLSSKMLSARKNPAESRILRRITRTIEQLSPNSSDYRKKRYARGTVESFDLSSFGKPDDFVSVDANCDEVMAYLRGVRVVV